jgi:DNA-binding SARP family transcriptional activator
MNRDRPVSQEHLLKLFWPDKDSRGARHNLSVAIYNIRRILEPELEKGRKSFYLSNQYHIYQFHSPPHFWYDVDVFTRGWERGNALVRQGERSQAWEVFTVVEQLYKTGYLSEVQNVGWIEEERKRLREIYVEMVLWLCAEAYRRQDYNTAVWYARKALAHDSCREEAYQWLMRAYLRLGKRTAAIQQYEICHDLLKKNYGLVPLQETRDLYRRILQGGEREDE